MPRPLLDEAHVHAAVREAVAGYRHAFVAQAQAAVAAHPVVVLGMAQNPFVRRARRLLDEAGITYQYIERGSYFSGWRERLAWKMWTGWPTLPMVFVRGTLVGGASDVQRLLASGELQRLLA
ncbi:glutaredoxin [Aquincola sp. MAHUQ-54]|uniref:Glutaredoxin n=1 Tax=Aquincola agrisoli TaxID=3119538 RepID=A0AAW9QHR9_9BURK